MVRTISSLNGMSSKFGWFQASATTVFFPFSDFGEPRNLSLTKILCGSLAGAVARGTVNLTSGLCHIFESLKKIQNAGVSE